MHQHRAFRPATAVAFVRGPLPLFGPAFVAAIAYVDPGNFATNITAGSTYGYLLLWVLIVSNLMAMLIQYLSAKAGIATGKSLAELCRDAYPRGVTYGLWAQAEVVAIATDLAEVLGGALAPRLCSPSRAKATTAVIRPPTSSGSPKSSRSASAPPSTSARSVAMATISAWAHRP